MPLEEYKIKLVNRILLANSLQNTKMYIDHAIKVIEQDNFNENLLYSFIDKISTELDSFNPIDSESQQWSNITFARVYLYRIKRDYKKVTV